MQKRCILGHLTRKPAMFYEMITAEHPQEAMESDSSFATCHSLVNQDQISFSVAHYLMSGYRNLPQQARPNLQLIKHLTKDLKAHGIIWQIRVLLTSLIC